MKKIFLLIFILLSVNVYCQDNIPDTTNISERIQTIQKMLDSSKKRVDLWNYGWLGAYSAATVGQGVAYFSSNDLITKQDMALGAGTTLLGAVFQLMNPLNTRKSANELSQMPDSTSDEKILKLMAAEEYIRNISQKELDGRSWKIHTLNTAVNLGSGLITWLGYKRSVWDGVANFLLNSAVTEIQIWTQPTRSAKDYKNYCEKYKNNNFQVERKPSHTEFLVSSTLSGVSLTIKF